MYGNVVLFYRIKDGAKLTRQLSTKLKRSESVQAHDETVEPQETDGTLIQDELAKKGSVILLNMK